MTTTVDVFQMPDVSVEVAKYNAIEAAANGIVIEQSVLIHELMLAPIALTHVLLPGEAGVAKTFADDVLGSFFDDTVIKFYAPGSADLSVDFLVGPVSLKGLQEDELRHNYTGMLPMAHRALVDEVMKLPDVTLNVFLPIMNERRYIAAPGKPPHVCPLWTITGTTNMEEFRDNGMIAAWRDRFGATLVIGEVASREAERKILLGQDERHRANVKVPKPPANLMMSFDEMLTLQNAARLVTHPPDVIEALLDVREAARKEGLHPSIRRFGQLSQRMKAEAIIRGASSTRTDYIPLAQHMLWNNPDDATVAYELIVGYAGQSMSRAHKLRKALEPVQESLKDLATKVDPTTGRPGNEFLTPVANANAEITVITGLLGEAMRDAEASGEDMTDLLAVQRDLKSALNTVKVYLGFPPDRS